MKKNIISTSIFAMACVFGISYAEAASSIRSFGGVGTYTSASNAATAKDTSSDSNSVRSASVGRTLSGTSGTKVSGSNSESASSSAATSRLSIGKYLSGGTSVSNGAKVVSQNVASNGTDTSEITEEVNSLRTTVEGLETSKQDNLTAGTGIDITNGVISSDVALDLSDKEDIANKSVNMTTDTGSTEKYPTVSAVETFVDGQIAGKADTADVNTALGAKADTTALTAKEDITNKSANITTDTGSTTKYPSVSAVESYVASALSGIDLSNYSTTTEMNTAITNAITASLPDLSVYSTTTEMNTAIANAVMGVDLSGYSTTAEMNTAITNAVTTALSTYMNAADTNTAISTAVSGKEDVANKSDSIATDTGSTTKYTTVNAVETYVATEKVDGAPSDGNDYVTVVNSGAPSWKQVVY